LDSEEAEVNEVTMTLPEEIRLLLFDLTAEDDCDYDHHGYCQAHMWFEDDVVCPVKRAKEILGTEAWTRITVNTLTTPVRIEDGIEYWLVKK
jgi:hypothetical protein